MVDDARTRPPPSLRTWARSTEDRIAAQAALVARLTPGTRQHRVATEVLLLLTDSLHVLQEARRLVAQSRASVPPPGIRTARSETQSVPRRPEKP